MRKLRVGIIFGGRSEEHSVSVMSARHVAAHLGLEKYEPLYIGITKSGAWKLCDGPEGEWEDGGRSVALSPEGLLILDDGRYEGVALDVVLPVLHGRYGEDGTIQGLLELSRIPYAGCDVQSSALCMDKSLAYIVVRSAGIATPSFVTVTPDDDVDVAPLAYPAFVKPARSGSSFGVTKVSRAEDLAPAIENARQYDSKVVIEEAVAGSEVGCAIYGHGADLFVGELDQIVLSDGFFKIHQERAPADNAQVIVPANIPAGDRARVQETAKAVYRALGCSGLARVDMFLAGDGEVVLNEVNTLPGLTTYSRYPRMMAAAGLSFADVIDRVVSLALAER